MVTTDIQSSKRYTNWKNNPNIIKLVLELLSYINMTEEEKEDYLYEYIDTFVEALYNKSGEH